MPIPWNQFLLEPQGGVALGFDLVKRELHEESSTVTKKKIDEGAAIGDGVVDEGATLTITATMFQFAFARMQALPTKLDVPPPSGLFASPIPDTASLYQSTVDADAVGDMFEALHSVRLSGLPCKVTTSHRVYENMLLTKVSLPRDKPGCGEFTLSFEERRTAVTVLAAAPVPLVSAGAAPVSAGTQTPTAAEAPSGPKASFAVGLLG